jgi:hypothetical protein
MKNIKIDKYPIFYKEKQKIENEVVFMKLFLLEGLDVTFWIMKDST